MPDVEAVRVCPTCAVPLMVGAPVARLFTVTATDPEQLFVVSDSKATTSTQTP